MKKTSLIVRLNVSPDRDYLIAHEPTSNHRKKTALVYQLQSTSASSAKPNQQTGAEAGFFIKAVLYQMNVVKLEALGGT